MRKRGKSKRKEKKGTLLGKFKENGQHIGIEREKIKSNTTHEDLFSEYRWKGGSIIFESGREIQGPLGFRPKIDP
jgi:hypothetical protein